MRVPCRFLNGISPLGITVLCFTFGLAVLTAGGAEAREEVLRWTHARSAEVVRWEAHVGPSSGNYNQVIPLNDAAQGSDGVFQATIDVPDTAVVYIALRAIAADNLMSPISNERERGPGGGGGGGGGGGTTSVGAGIDLTPSSGALVRADFNNAATGTAVAGWVDTRANFSLATDDNLFGVVDVAGNRMLMTASSDDDIHSHMGSVFSNATLRGRMAVDRAEAALGVTAYSQYPSGDAYYRLGRDAGGAFVIAGRPGLVCANPSTGVVPTPGDWYRFELRVQSESGSNRIQATVWNENASRPSGPQAECVDAQAGRAVNGVIGVWSAGSGQKYWDDLEVLSSPPSGGGGPPEPPVLIQIVPVGQ